MIKCPRCGETREAQEPEDGCRDPSCPTLDMEEFEQESCTVIYGHDDGDPAFIPVEEWMENPKHKEQAQNYATVLGISDSDKAMSYMAEQCAKWGAG